MIASVHIASPGIRRALQAFRSKPRPGAVDGLTYAESVLPAPFSTSLLPRASLSEVGLIAAWEDDESLDRFVHESSAGEPFADGWHVRLRPLRVFGAWAPMPGLPKQALETADDEPVVVLTLGRLRRRRLPSFLRTNAPAEAELIGSPGLLAATAFAHPPYLVSTFSVWRTAAEMRAYAHARAGAHMGAVRSDRERPFHHESAFIRFRPYHSAGSWGGGDPLAGLLSLQP